MGQQNSTNLPSDGSPVWRRDTFAYWVAGLASLAFLVTWQLPFQPAGIGLQGYVPLHSFLEIFSVVIAGTIFIVGWQAKTDRELNVLTLLAIGFLGVALLDTGHLLSFKDMPSWITPSGTTKTIHFWFYARFLAAFTLLAFVIASLRVCKINARIARIGLIAVLALVAVATWITLGSSELLPVFFTPESGLTLAKLITEWTLVLIVAGTLVLVWRKRKQARLFDPASLMAALWLTCLSELCFTLYSDASDVFNLIGHIYKVMSYGFLYKAIIVGGVRLPYKLLTENRETLQQLTDNIPQVFWMLSPDTEKLLYLSPAYESIWQRPRADLLRNPSVMFDSIHPDDREHARDSFMAMAKGEVQIDYRVVRPDGSLRHIRTRSFPIREANGDTFRIAGVSEDRTQEIRAQEAMEQKDRLLQQTQSIAHLGSWEYDPASRQFTCSEEVFRILGLPIIEEPVVYESLLENVHPEDRSQVEENFLSSIKSREKHNEEELRIIRNSTQEERYVHMEYFHRRDEKGYVTRTIGILHDITEKKLAEREQKVLFKQLVQAQKMEAVGHLTGGIAHDFNNILGAILGFSYLLTKFDPKSMNIDDYRSYASEISAAGNRAKELISQMLIFSRQKPEDDMDGNTSVIVKPVVSEVLHLLRQSIPATFELRSRIRNGDLSAEMHPIKFHQILMNLIINARDASVDGYGIIEIDADTQHYSGVCSACRERIDGEYVVLSVSDDGEGISEEIRSHIFDPFFTTKDVGRGSGMGLSVVHGLVHSQHGHIVVSPGMRGKGTTFEVLLVPSKTEDPSTQDLLLGADAENEKSLLKGLRIMLVDDEKSVLTATQGLLEHYGAHITSFESPDKALARFRDSPEAFDLVVTDNAMPKRSGLDLSRKLTDISPALPIILCTGYSENITEAVLREHGISRLFKKPVTWKYFIEEISALADQGTRIH